MDNKWTNMHFDIVNDINYLVILCFVLCVNVLDI